MVAEDWQSDWQRSGGVADNELQLIELAQQQRLISRKQAELVRSELEMFPGERAGHLMVRKSFITEEQLRELRGEPADQAPVTEPASANQPDPHVSAALDNVDEMDTVKTRRPKQSEIQQDAEQQPLQPKTLPLRPPGGQSSDAVRQSGEFYGQVMRGGAMPDDSTGQAPAPAASPPQPAAAPPPSTSQKIQNLENLLRLARHWGCSDLHITVGRPPVIRLNGQIRYMEMDVVTEALAEQLVLGNLSSEDLMIAKEKQQLDYSWEIPGAGRHRCNVFKTRLGWDGAYRIISNAVPTIEQLGLPQSIKQLSEFAQGLVMVTGPSGSGKTTTVAAMLDLVNSTRREHIITVEDPVEYIIPGKMCQITQREVGRDTQSFAKALRASLREDPDIIFVGEMRDEETTSIAISASETGHLVFGTMHTSSAARTVARIVDVFPLNQQSQIMTMVAESLRGVIAQMLVPRRDGQGRALALEVMVNTSGIASQIKDGKSHLVSSAIQSGKRQGMMLMDDSLMALYQQQLISGHDAWLRASNKKQFEAIKET